MSDTGTAKPGRSGSDKPGRSGSDLSLPGRIALFFRQVVAELRKVIWPTRKELITYTGVVLVFVLAMAGIVAFFDFAFGQGVLRIFGG